MPKKSTYVALALCASALAPINGQAQPAPIGIEAVPLNDLGYIMDTAEVHGVHVSVIAKDFPQPFAIDFLPNGNLLVAERTGNLRIIPNATSPGAAMLEQPISGMPLPGTSQGNFGLHDIAVHPDFEENGLIYWTWNIPVPNAENPDEPPEQGRFSIMRGLLSANGLTNVETIFEVDEPAYASGTRVAIGPDGMVYATTSAPFGPEGQDLASPYGKVLRLNPDGTMPADNPFTGQEGAHPAIFTLGHRDQHGLVVTTDGAVFSAEHGPNGGDELNAITPGSNYGWPVVSLGRNYDGTPMDVPMQAEGITDPMVAWLPSIGISGLMHYTADAIPEWQGNFFIASARQGQVNQTGGLVRVAFNEEWGELRRETLLGDLHQRVRDIATGPDGLIYALTDGPENAVLRIAPTD